ncbi:MAG: outer membrane lipid asymmetry maintenance protein MlaD [Pseudomonadota bacterium]
MRENTTEVVVGAAVLAVAASFLWYLVAATGLSGGTPGISLKANFTSAEGVTVGTDVRMAGVSVGTVTGLELNLDTYRAEATFAIDEGVAIPDDTAVVVASEGLLGGTFVELVPGGSFDFYADGATIRDTQSAVSLIQLLMAFVGSDDDA